MKWNEVLASETSAIPANKKVTKHNKMLKGAIGSVWVGSARSGVTLISSGASWLRFDSLANNLEGPLREKRGAGVEAGG